MQNVIFNHGVSTEVIHKLSLPWIATEKIQHHSYNSGTHLCVVGLVWCKNHIDVKLIAKPSTPLIVATTQNMGIRNAGLLIRKTLVQEMK